MEERFGVCKAMTKIGNLRDFIRPRYCLLLRVPGSLKQQAARVTERHRRPRPSVLCTQFRMPKSFGLKG